jgi:UDP-N-acetylglucosamine 2-epimerase (non-hydrolysing)
MPLRFKVVSVAGARPNFIKIAPIAAEFARCSSEFEATLVHTGQHYDDKLSRVFFDELAIPRPDVNLNAGSGSHAQQTAAIMAAFEPVLLERRPDLVLVVGDVNSTIACALVASKLGIPIAHVEAGLRSYDRTMPEEINRVLTDQISDLLFTTEEDAAKNLAREGIEPSRVHFVGNVMIDTLLTHRQRAQQLRVAERFDLRDKAYGVITLHRPSNVDDPAMFARLFDGIGVIAGEMPLVFPVHPRTRTMLAASTRAAALMEAGRLKVIEPLGYLDFLGLMDASRLVLTDSGGIQEETTILGVPCLTLRQNTERPVTLTHGTNHLVGTDPDRIVDGWRRLREQDVHPGLPPLWDGQAAVRIVAQIRRFCGG